MYINCEVIKNDVHIWERYPGQPRRHLTVPCEWSCYIESEDGDHTSLDKRSATFHEFDSRFALMHAVKTAESLGKKVFESDIPPDLKALARWYPFDENKVPTLHVSYLDIEVDYKTFIYPETHKVLVRRKGSSTSKELEVGILREANANELAALQVYDPQTDVWVTASRSEFVYDGPIGQVSALRPYAPINAVALHNDWENKTYIIAVPPPAWGEDPDEWDKLLDEEFKQDDPSEQLILVDSEEALLTIFLKLISDSDALIGWNSDFFDFPYILARVDMIFGTRGIKKLSFPGAPLPKTKEVIVKGQVNIKAEFGGRILMDYMNLFKKFDMENRASYKLESVADEELPELPKLHYPGTLEQLYRKDFNHFLRYNKRDTVVLTGFEKNKGYIAVAVLLYHMSSGRFRDVAGTLRLADMAIVNYCHDVLNVVAPDAIMPEQADNDDDNDDEDGAEGAFVLPPKVGMRVWGGAVDINSLYPSAIRSVNISPEKLLGQFDEAVLAFEHIYNRMDVQLTLQWNDGRRETRSAIKWREWLLEQQYAISGYGTVFDQSSGPGVIPSILTDWFAKRKHYQKLKGQAASELEALIKKHAS